MVHMSAQPKKLEGPSAAKPDGPVDNSRNMNIVVMVLHLLALLSATTTTVPVRFYDYCFKLLDS